MKATITTPAVYVTCPRCGTGQANPVDGSYAWPVEVLGDDFLCQNPGCCQRLAVRHAKMARLDK